MGLVLFLAATFGLRCWNWDQVFVQGDVYFVDADCYSRMTRVRQVMEHPFHPIRHHGFENAPEGVVPHTTSPMDFAVAALAFVLRPFSPQALDLAGAFISPLLGMMLTGFLWAWSRDLNLPFRHALLLVVGTSPILVHGFLLGRPDHQSLILLLCGVALAAEIAVWTRRSRGWEILSAVAWALALWTSLFEPAILLAATAVGRVLVLGRRALPDRAAAAAFAAILAGGTLFDGWRFQPPGPEIREFFPRWALTIGELNHLRFGQLFVWTGWLLPVVPALLVLRFAKARMFPCLALALLLAGTIGLSLWYARWGYFLALVFAFSLPFALAAVPRRPLVWLLFLVSLWPIAAEWDRMLYPDAARQAALAENREDAVLLRATASALTGPEPKIILAPWWLSPAIAYWSGQPCVAGSSHQSLPGTVETARFYLATGTDAAEILRRRQVTFVISYEPSRILGNSAQILGRQPDKSSMGQVLYDRPFAAPQFLRLVSQNTYFRVYEFLR